MLASGPAQTRAAGKAWQTAAVIPTRRGPQQIVKGGPSFECQSILEPTRVPFGTFSALQPLHCPQGQGWTLGGPSPL